MSKKIYVYGDWESVAEKIGLSRASILRMENCFKN